MSADLLRRAAAKLRETAELALPAPWTVIPVPGDRGYDVTAFPSLSVYVAQDLSEYDAEWIALMGPALAEPLAEWLESVAAEGRASRRTGPMAVARAILGEAS